MPAFTSGITMDDDTSAPQQYLGRAIRQTERTFYARAILRHVNSSTYVEHWKGTPTYVTTTMQSKIVNDDPTNASSQYGSAYSNKH
ncbi:unnamed protein product [Gongylonema pulchrum]|uniref:Uncharacterized protein n=1 Tax=Gongylonema pulchrum TaxID=637853 RepID=A0A183DYD5_9BILA|nr:unnamed protein product [Gongylonema pulchrum]